MRYANVIGPRLKHEVVYDFVVKLSKSPSELEVLGDGKQVRSYVYVDDAVETTMIAWRKSANNFEVYNVASEDWITVDEARAYLSVSWLNAPRAFRCSPEPSP